MEVETASEPVVISAGVSSKSLMKGADSELSFEVITNDDLEMSWKGLIDCKVLFGRQLPRMPKDYMVRLLFDKRHFCFRMLKEGKLLGACCFRPFAGVKVFEIVFLAVSAGEQVKGFGTTLMGQLKAFAQSKGVCDLVTYADVAAVGYFTKQGFFPAEKSSFPSEWDGHIKDYDGAHLMRCRIYPEIDYLNYTKFVSDFKQSVYKQVLQNINPKRWPGLSARPARIEDVPGVTLPAQQKSLEAQISDIIEAAFSHKSSWPFQDPVDVKEATDYLEIVQSPTDLSTMRKRNSQRGFRTAESFKLEMKLMFDNCFAYNGKDTVYTREAVILEKFVMPRIERLCKKDLDTSDEEPLHRRSRK